MSFKHCGLLSWVHERNGRPKTQKPCARLRDADTRSASGDPAMVFIFRMASILSGRTGTLPVMPSGRIAAGRLSSTIFSGSCPLHMIVSEIGVRFLRKIMRKRARDARVNRSTTNIVLFEQRLVTRLVLPLDVIEE